MENEFRPHLTIPLKTEIVDIENSPQARTKDRGVDHAEHGAKLSLGLQNIFSAYSKIQSGDSLSNEDIRIFEVVLPEGEKLKHQRDFLEQEGMTINVVKNEREAIVSTSKSKFDKLRERVGGYKDNGSTKKYQYIDTFSFVNAREKQERYLLEDVGKINDKEIPIDVQIMLVPKVAKEIRNRAEKYLVNKIKELNGNMPVESYELSDTTSTIIHASIPVARLEEISKDTFVYRVSQTTCISQVTTNTPTPLGYSLSLDTSVNLDGLPIVAILDDGVDFPKELKPVVFRHWKPSDCSIGGKALHGTPVASKVAFKEVGKQLENKLMVPRTRIIDCNIIDRKKR